ncbi:hypothetical protein [Janibacter sp. G1551]|uniref:hypothetical protein n=1 Tax=Janibacter sp. G1551 TaxID=3420440 RepID=UPI003D075CC6
MLRLRRYHGDQLRGAAIISIGPNAYRRPSGIAVAPASLLICLIMTFLMTFLIMTFLIIVVIVIVLA